MFCGCILSCASAWCEPVFICGVYACSVCMYYMNVLVCVPERVFLCMYVFECLCFSLCIWGVGRSPKRHKTRKLFNFQLMYINLFSGKCPFGQTAFGNVAFGHLSHSGICCNRANFYSGKCVSDICRRPVYMCGPCICVYV